MARPNLTGEGAGYALPLALVAAAIVALIVVTYAQRAFDLDHSAIGFDGLAAWLSKNGVEARTFSGGDRLTRDRVGLRIYPLFDVDLGPQSPEATSTSGPLRLGGLPAVELDVVRRKRAAAPTLIVLPKWRKGVVELGVAHPKLLIPAMRTARLVSAVAPEAGPLLPRGEGFTAMASQGGAVKLYAGQLVKAGSCEPLIGSADAMLLGHCGSRKAGYWLLADPDLIDNHGLTRGENARTAAAVLSRLAGGRPVVVDLTTTAIWDEAPQHQPERSWSDLLRFFQPPFTAAWAALLLVIVLVVWRASIRTGPIEAASNDLWRAARTVSIDARARLLRLSGHDATLVRVYASDRLQSLAEELFGRHRTGGDALEQVGRLLRAAPALSASFRQAFDRDREEPASEAELLRRIDDLAKIRERILDEFGRTARSRAAHPG